MSFHAILETDISSRASTQSGSGNPAPAASTTPPSAAVPRMQNAANGSGSSENSKKRKAPVTTYGSQPSAKTRKDNHKKRVASVSGHLQVEG
jgi:hypothetical protein